MSLKTFTGKGVCGFVDNKKIAIGNIKMMLDLNINVSADIENSINVIQQNWENDLLHKCRWHFTWLYCYC